MQTQATYKQSVPFLRLPRYISSYWLGNLRPSCSSLLLAISENTLGWQKESDLISNYQLKKLTGLSEKTIVRARKKLVELGLITYAESYSKRGDRTANRYGICIDRIMQKNAPDGILKAKKVSPPPPPIWGGHNIEREHKERVNDCAHTREEKEEEQESVTRSIQIEEKEISIEELEMQRMLDEQLSKLGDVSEMEIALESAFEATKIDSTIKTTVFEKKKNLERYERFTQQSYKSSLRIVSSKSQIANVFNAPVARSASYTNRRLPVEAHIAKFNQKQLQAFSFLESIQTDINRETKAWLASIYSEPRLREVYNEAVRRGARSIGAYMQTILKKGSVVVNSRIETNALFAKKFREEQKWYALHINAKHAVFDFCGMKEEVEFNIPVEQFPGYMQRKHALYQSNCRR